MVHDFEDVNLDALNKILFDQIRRLEKARGSEELEIEIARSVAIVKVGKITVDAGKVGLAAYDLLGGSRSIAPALVALPDNPHKK